MEAYFRSAHLLILEGRWHKRKHTAELGEGSWHARGRCPILYLLCESTFSPLESSLKLNEMAEGVVIKELHWECHLFKLHREHRHLSKRQHRDSVSQGWSARDGHTLFLPGQSGLDIHTERLSVLGQGTVGNFSATFCKVLPDTYLRAVSLIFPHFPPKAHEWNKILHTSLTSPPTRFFQSKSWAKQARLWSVNLS